MSTKKLNLKTTLAVLTLVLGLGVGTMGAAQAKDVAVKEFPKQFRGYWGNAESATFGISKNGMSFDDSSVEIKKLEMDPKDPNTIKVTYRITMEEEFNVHDPIQHSTYKLIAGKKLIEVSGKKTWGPYFKQLEDME